ncbi:MAG: DUF2272 domain-containing protein [Nanoarchaeota archaeon]
MVTRKKINKSLFVLLIIFLVSILASSVIAPSLITPGQASATVLAQPAAQTSSATQLSSGVTCLNTQQCTEIDDVWRLIGEFVRGSIDIWDPTISPAQWRSLSAVRPSVTGGTTVPGTISGPCPEGMANIDNKYCIDKWEASIVDKNNPSQPASIFYPADNSWANVYYNKWVNGWEGTLPNNEYKNMPSRGSEAQSGFAPLAVTKEGVIPNMHVSKEIAEQACANAGKRLCSQEEWLKGCQGPSGTNYPYGNNYIQGNCNMQSNKYPPATVGWTNIIPADKFDPSDPRNGQAAVNIEGVKKTGSYPECTNAYGVYDMVGNLAEVVSTPSSSGKALFLGSAFMRDNDLSCTTGSIGAHGVTYTDYSFGFRCCADLSSKASAPEVSSKPPTSGNQVREAIAKVAYEEWNKWDQGARKETEPAMQPLVLAYWNAAGYDNIMPWAWSAAFVSYVAKTAGTDFPGRKAHTNYFEAIQKGESTQCKTYPPAEKNNIGKGDIICFCRDDPLRDKGAPCHIAYNAVYGESHCDVVVEVLGDDRFEVIGGNVNNNVEKRARDLNDPAFSSKFYGFVSCANSGSTVPLTSPPSATGYTIGPGTFAGLNYKDQTHLLAVVQAAKQQGINPCYALTVVYEESKGVADAVGTDANVPGCDIPARRNLLMKQSTNCQRIYQTADALKTECMQNRDLTFTRYNRPKSGVNACLDDLLNTQQYKLSALTKTDFCNGNFDNSFTYGIGLGQFTPAAGSSVFTLGSTSYSHCDLFDPQKSIQAIVTHLKNKGAESAGSDDQILSVFAGYGGVSKTYPGLQTRLNSFKTCAANYN